MANRISRYAERLAKFSDIALDGDAIFERRDSWRKWLRSSIGERFDDKLIFEVGCFDAELLSRVAAKHPTTAFVGLDWKYKAIHDGAIRIRDAGLRNVALLRGRAQDIAQIFGDRELDEIWIFHPDPCDRDVELPNRLIAPPFLADLHRILRDDQSTLCLKTDHPGYYQWVLALFGLPEPAWFPLARGGLLTSDSPRVRANDLMPPSDLPAAGASVREQFEICINATDFWADAAAQVSTGKHCFAGETTLFERRFLKKRLPIYYLESRKSRGTSP